MDTAASTGRLVLAVLGGTYALRSATTGRSVLMLRVFHSKQAIWFQLANITLW